MPRDVLLFSECWICARGFTDWKQAAQAEVNMQLSDNTLKAKCNLAAMGVH
jgi:hypothetical protein